VKQSMTDLRLASCGSIVKCDRRTEDAASRGCASKFHNLASFLLSVSPRLPAIRGAFSFPFPSHRRGGSLGPTTSKRTHRPSKRRRKLLASGRSPRWLYCGPITRSGDGRRRPPDRQVDARAFLAYASLLWHTANDSTGTEAQRWPLQGPSVRGVPEGLAHHTGSSQKVSLKTLL
jgi:hypothetical protein